jgi:hypothetical protein
MGIRLQRSEHRCMGWQRYGRLAYRMLKRNPLFGEKINVGCITIRISVTSKMVCTERIDGYEYYIFLWLRSAAQIWQD